MLSAEPVTGQDADLVAALNAERLPTEDLNQAGRRFHRFVDEQGLVGFGGLEGHGPDQLIRSVVTTPARRGQGLGQALLTALEAEARHDGAERLHLLTTTAAPFFSRYGYQAADRATAPDAIAASREFASLCPASAAYMTKTVAP